MFKRRCEHCETNTKRPRIRHSQSSPALPNNLLDQVLHLPPELIDYLHRFIFFPRDYGKASLLWENGCSQCGISVNFLDSNFDEWTPFELRAFSYELGPGFSIGGRPRLIEAINKTMAVSGHGPASEIINQSSMQFIPLRPPTPCQRIACYPFHRNTGLLTQVSVPNRKRNFVPSYEVLNYRHCSKSCYDACRAEPVNSFRIIQFEAALHNFLEKKYAQGAQEVCIPTAIGFSYNQLFPAFVDF